MTTVWNDIFISIQSGVPTLLWGEPGIGKTAKIKQFAESLDLHLEVVIASIREPSDFGGLPIIDNGSVKLAPPQWAKNLVEAGGGILFLDEISTAPPAVQAALLCVVLDKKVGDLQLPENTLIVAAANPPECSSGGWDLSAPLANRFTHFHLMENFEDWSNWANGISSVSDDVKKLPETWKNEVCVTLPVLAGFLKQRPNLLHKLPEDYTSGNAWPSPRSWEMASILFAAANSIGAKPNSETVSRLLISSVGEGAARECIAYLNKVELPNPEEILNDPSSWKLSDRSDLVFAGMSSVLSFMSNNVTKKLWGKSWVVVSYLYDNGKKDVAMAMATALIRRKEKWGFELPKSVLKLKDIVKLISF